MAHDGGGSAGAKDARMGDVSLVPKESNRVPDRREFNLVARRRNYNCGPESAGDGRATNPGEGVSDW